MSPFFNPGARAPRREHVSQERVLQQLKVPLYGGPLDAGIARQGRNIVNLGIRFDGESISATWEHSYASRGQVAPLSRLSEYFAFRHACAYGESRGRVAADIA